MADHTIANILKNGNSRRKNQKRRLDAHDSKSGDKKICVSDASPDVITLHTIDLLFYERSLLQCMDKCRNQSSQLPPPPPIPELPECVLTYRRPGSVKDRLKDSDFVQGIGTSPCIIPHNISWEILKKAVGILCVHAGFETTTASVLDTLTDIAQDYFSRICSVFRRNEDQTSCRNPAGTINLLEQTLHDIDFGSMKVLHDFYQRRIVDYHEKSMNACELALKKYDSMRRKFNDHGDRVENKDGVMYNGKE